MRTSSILRTVCGLVLFCAISSFSGCDKTTDARPTAGKSCKKPTTTSDTTRTTGAN
ncbi:hypothetical protein [Hymenobacter wooponensis]|uniref:hypothetical protein n=1 Tax=Hymenobacter wooponensis TaxID=1525360 RepID=UPI00143688CE|nr:hypothetical protein [Hymenobacter wooponensis]